MGFKREFILFKSLLKNYGRLSFKMLTATNFFGLLFVDPPWKSVSP